MAQNVGRQEMKRIRGQRKFKKFSTEERKKLKLDVVPDTMYDNRLGQIKQTYSEDSCDCVDGHDAHCPKAPL